MTSAVSPDLMPDCRHCRHRSGVGFVDLSDSELHFMSRFKAGHAAHQAGTVLIEQEQAHPSLFILYSGFAMRRRRFGDGRTRILSLLLPGDLAGLDTLCLLPSTCSVEALTDVTCCEFDAARWDALMAIPSLARRVSAVQSLDQRMTEIRLAASATNSTTNLCQFIGDVYFGLRRRRLVSRPDFRLPLRLNQLADMLGLTPTHLRRILRRLESDGILSIRRGRVIIGDVDRIADLSLDSSEWSRKRPLI